MKLKHVLRDEEGGGAGTAGGAPAAPAPAPAPGATPDSAAPAAAPSLLAQAGTAPAPVQPGAEDPAAAKVTRDASVPAWVPDKFKTGEDLAKAYGELESRMKSAGLPPKAADEYTWTPPEGVKLDERGTKQFKEFAHGLGLTQTQYQGVMKAYTDNLGTLAADVWGYSADKAAVDLKKLPGWESEEGFRGGLSNARHTLEAFLPPEKVAQFEAINHPVVWELLSNIGRELGEDAGMHAAAHIQSAESLESLMKHPAYFDAKHAEHATVKAKVQAHFNAQESIARRQRLGQ